MIGFSLRDPDGESYDVVADSRHLAVWEKTSRKGETFVKLLAEMNILALYRLAHITARREGIPVPEDLNDFQHEWVLELADQLDVVPTPGAANSET